VPGRAERDLKIVCGHWSTLGLFIGLGVHAIDTGAVWGGTLTALQLDTDELRVVQVPGRDVPATAPRPRAPQQQRARPRGPHDRPAAQRGRPERHPPGRGGAKPGLPSALGTGARPPQPESPPKGPAS
jgi:bis(5'-nucleosyl)-tetraphosphatase (symmetrical)